jgi:Na+/proline symporter
MRKPSTSMLEKRTQPPSSSPDLYSAKESGISLGRFATLAAILLSIATGYLALSFNHLMDYPQLLFSPFNAPLLATFLLGMFTTWATPNAGFWGLLLGVLSSIAHNFAYRMHWITYGSDMSANFYGAILAWASCFLVTALLSAFTAAKSREELGQPHLLDRDASRHSDAECGASSCMRNLRHLPASERCLSLVLLR